jgi:hypothetical protein
MLTSQLETFIRKRKNLFIYHIFNQENVEEMHILPILIVTKILYFRFRYLCFITYYFIIELYSIQE